MISATVRMLVVVWIASFSLATRAADDAASPSHELNVNGLLLLAGARDIGYQYSINRYVGVLARSFLAGSPTSVPTRVRIDVLDLGLMFSLPVKEYQSAYLGAGRASYRTSYTFDTGRPEEIHSGIGSFLFVGYKWEAQDDPMTLSVELGRGFFRQTEVVLPSGETSRPAPSWKYFGVRLGFAW